VTLDRLEELLRGDVPAEDRIARERARARLRATIGLERARSPARGRPRLAAFAVASLAAAIVLVVLQLLLPVGPAGPRLSAAAEIRELGRISSQQTSLDVNDSEYLYRREDEVRLERHISVTVDGNFVLETHVTVESWVASDGSGEQRTLYESVDFASSEDRQAWLAAGAPELPRIGKPIDEDYGKGGLPFYTLADLPTEPAALEEALSKGLVIAEAPGEANRLSTIGTLLAQGNASADLRQALFEVAAGIPGVVVDSQATDPVGRPAVSVSVTDPSGETRLFFSSIDASLLGSTESHPATEEEPRSTETHAYQAWGVASTAGERPSSQLRPSNP
jgi:hypothetical protein